MATKKKTNKKATTNKKSTTEVKENKKMNRKEFVETITEMCERLNESGLLDELNMVELEDGLTAEQLTDLFCDAIEYVESQDKAGELDDDMVDFYEGEPWKELPDEDEEPELEEDGTETEEECECVCETEDVEEVVEEEPTPEPVAKKTAKKKVVEKIAKGKKPVVKKAQEPVEKPKKKVIKKKASVETEKEEAPKPVVNKKAKTVEKTKPAAKKPVQQSSTEKDEFGFKVGTKMNLFAQAIKAQPMTMAEVCKASWNETGNQCYGTYKLMQAAGQIDKDENGKMFIVGHDYKLKKGKK